jgi:phage terminase large subunit-like protein
VWLARKYPDKRHAYITYSGDRACGPHVSRTFRRLLTDAGIIASGTLADTILPGGGSVAFRGIEGGITGLPIDGLCILDDVFKDRVKAGSSRYRDFVDDQFRSAIVPRLHPGASVVVMATRWDPDDLSGRLIADGWESINLPALAEEDDPNGREVGDALFPEKFPIDELEKLRRGVLDFTWQALYQGHPRPPGGKIFREPSWYTRLPEQFTAIYGLDLAYTAKTSADWSVCCLMLKEERPGLEPLFYVVHMDRAQVEAPEFALTLKVRHVQRRGLRMIWRASGTEKGAAQFLIRQGLPVGVRPPPGDKLVAATGVAAAWNDGRVMLPDLDTFPEEHEWVLAVLDRARDFTGSPGGKDDEIDAMGNAFDELTKRQPQRPVIASIG